MFELVRYIILSAVVYRVSRFIIMDTGFMDWLTGRVDEGGERITVDKHDDPVSWRQLNFVKRKTAELMGCPWCVTVWIAAAVVLLTWLFSDDLPMPWFYWPALSAGGLVFWAIIDHE